MIGATRRENRSGWRAAIVFGVISPKMRSTAVMTPVATHGPQVEPMSDTKSIVATEAESTLTALFATRSVESIRSGWEDQLFKSASSRIGVCQRCTRSREIPMSAGL